MKKFLKNNKTAVGVFALALGVFAYKKGWISTLFSKIGINLPQI